MLGLGFLFALDEMSFYGEAGLRFSDEDPTLVQTLSSLLSSFGQCLYTHSIPPPVTHFIIRCFSAFLISSSLRKPFH